MAGVLVFAEVKDGKIKKASREALTIGRKLAEAAGGDLTAFTNDRTIASDAGKYGVKQLFVANAGEYSTESYTSAFAEAIKQSGASIVLLGGTSINRAHRSCCLAAPRMDAISRRASLRA